MDNSVDKVNFNENDELFDDSVISDDTTFKSDIDFDSDTSFDDEWESDDSIESDNVSSDFEDINDADASDYTDGAIVESDLTDDEDDNEDTDASDYTENSFRSNSGASLSVQDPNDDDERGFSITYLDITKIAITNHRIRSKKSVEGLVQSIKSTGLLEPLVVARTMTEGLYVLLAGYRRLLACAMVGKKRVPCIINNNINTNAIPIIEAMYNHNQKYTIAEQIDYINYLKTEQGIINSSMIEFLLQMNNGDYNKLEDILNDNDDDIVSKLMDGAYDISTAFKKLEQRRKKESAEEKEDKRAAQVYADEEESGANTIQGSGEGIGDTIAPTEEMLEAVNRNSEEIDEYLGDKDLDSMIKEDNELKGFEPHVQKVNEREYIDPAIKKAVMARDKSTCQCCRSGGPSYVDTLDYHHILPVFLGGNDSPDNAVMLCLSCHKLVHLYSTGDLTIEKDLLKSSYDDLSEQQKTEFKSRVKGEGNSDEQNSVLFEAEKNKMKRIVYYGSIIRKGIAQRGLNREQYKKDHPNTRVGRRMPGKTQQETT